MPENSDGANAPSAAAEQPSSSSNRRNRNRNRRSNSKNKASKFKGACKDLEGTIYEISSAGGDSFTKVNRIVAEYCARTVPYAGELRTAMINLQLDPLMPPAFPDVPENDPRAVELGFIWREERKTFSRRCEQRRQALEQVFAIVLGQCDPAVRARIQADANWDNINTDCDVIRMLQLIRNCEVQRQTRRDDMQTLVEATKSAINYRQGSQSNSEYYENFKDKVATADRLGACIGETPGLIQTRLIEVALDEDNPTPAELAQATLEVKEKFLARLFLTNADKKRYGGLSRDIENEHTRGNDTYPDDLTTAYDYIVNYVAPRAGRHSDDLGVSFFQEDDHPGNQTERGTRPQAGSRGGGRGGGRGPSPGRGGGRDGGRGRGRGRSGQSQRDRSQREIGSEPNDGGVHFQEDDDIEDDDAQFLLDNLDTDVNYYSLPFNLDEIVATTVARSHVPANKLLLLDSGSTLDMIIDETLLHDIHQVPVGIRVRCNAGCVYVDQQAYFGDFPVPVWFHPDGITNILSYHTVAKHYHIHYDNNKTDGKDAFVVTGPNNVQVKFEPTAKGLYMGRLDCNSEAAEAWAFVNLAEDRRDEYTKREYRDAVLARKVQNIIMFPGDQAYKKIVDSNLLPNCTVKRDDIKAAEHLFGKNIGALKGKTPYRHEPHVSGKMDSVPRQVRERFRRVTMGLDIMFVNKVPFLITYSNGIRFGTVANIPGRTAPQVAAALNLTLRIYHRRGMRIGMVKADPEFRKLAEDYKGCQFNLSSEAEHNCEIERYIRTVKDRSRSGYNSLPFERMPRVMIIRLVSNAVFWLNAFPHPDGVSSTLSPRYIMTGQQLDFKKHVRLEFGAYVQTHEEHSNGMEPRTQGAICLGPTGNEQGGHYFMSLVSGRAVVRNRWDELPMPRDAIARVGELGRRQGMPKSLTFADRFGHEILDDYDQAIDDEHDSDYDPDDESSQSSVSTDSFASSESSDSDDDDDDDNSDDEDDDDNDDDDDSDDSARRLPPPPAGVGAAPPAAGGDDDGDQDPATQTPDDTDDHIPVEEEEDEDLPELMSCDDSEDDDSDSDDERPASGRRAARQCINIRDDIVRSPRDDVMPRADSMPPENAGVRTRQQNAGVRTKQQNAGVRARATNVGDVETVRENDDDDSISGDEAGTVPDMEERYGERNRTGLRERKPRDYTHKYGSDFDYENAFVTFEQPMGELFLTEQMSLNKGLKMFGKPGASAVVNELKQLEMRKTIEPVRPRDMTQSQKRQALRYLMYLKEKRCGKIKARGCADGRKQREYKTKDETSAPTVSTEALFLTAAIDAHERRKVITVDIPGAFMHCDIDEEIFVKLEGAMAQMLVKVDPEKYGPYLTKENGKWVLYVRLLKALYGTLQAALLFWEDLSDYLVNELGFEANPYDLCVVNKTINGKQCTAIWHVDDIKISHVEQEALDNIADELGHRYGKETPLTVHRGTVHDYLGMTVDYSEDGKVKFIMRDYVEGLLDEAPADMDGTAITPASNNLLAVNGKADKLDDERAEVFHRLTAKLLYLCKRARPDLQPTVAFLTTRVTQPDVDDWKKLGRAIKYLRGSKHLWLTLEVDDKLTIKWWIDASFAVHPDMRSHTGATMSLGKGSPVSLSRKQKINTKSSTEAELVGVDDAMPLVIWTRNFLEGQGFTVHDNVVYQDNLSAMQLEKNGRSSSGRRTRHINIRYFFISDRVKSGDIRIEHCPTDDMIGDFFTKPLQGSKFRKFRQMILNTPPDVELYSQSVSQECVGKRSYADVVRGKQVTDGAGCVSRITNNHNPGSLKGILKKVATSTARSVRFSRQQ